ncbi:uncharacterized protein [Watersipora subatra]|uniref:uncharacterized protein isoform X2 n=1 Tax=Watersipora subatra TaxID=2589382 RepID=UPI00355BBCE7
MAADVVCKKCDDTYLCQPCFDSVHNSRVLASHKALAVADKNKGDFSLLETLVNGNCYEHPSKSKEYFCEQCSQAMCGDCAILGGHSSHSVNRLDVVNQKLVPKLKETRRHASIAVDLSEQSKKKILKERSGSADGFSSTANLDKIEEVFLRLHAMLQLKQHELEKKVHKASGSSTHLLEAFQEQALQTSVQMQSLVREIDRLLSNPMYERSCDFQEFLSKAEELLKQPCHFVINSPSTHSNVDIKINEDMLSKLSSIVSVSVESTPVNRYEMKSIADMPESEFESCLTVQPCNVAPFLHQSSSSAVQNVNSSSTQLPLVTAFSRQSSRMSVSSENCFEVGRPTHQLGPPTHEFGPPTHEFGPPTHEFGPPTHEFFPPHWSQPPRMPPAFEDNFGRGTTSGGASYNSDHDVKIRAQEAYIPDYSDCYKSFQYPPDDSIVPYNSLPHSQLYSSPPRPNRGHSFGQDSRISYNFENHEKSAQLYAHEQRSQEDIVFGSRDFRLADQHFNMQPTCPPVVSPPHQMVKPKVKVMAIGRGRGAPTATVRPRKPQGSAQQRTAVPNKKPLYMHPPAAITEKMTIVQVSHVDSPQCFYIQVPQRVSLLKKIQHRINDHCLSSSPITDMLGVKFLFVRVSGSWRRAEVLKVLDRSVEVFCSDYGDTVEVKASDTRPALGSLLSLPRQAVKCYLQGIQPSDGSDCFTTACSEQMKETLNHTSAVTLVKLDTPLIETDAQPADLLLRDQTTTSLLSMRDFLIFTEHAVWDSPCSPYMPPEKELNQAYLTPMPMKQGDTVRLYVTHVQSPHEIYAQVVDRQYDESQLGKTVEAELQKLDSIMNSMEERYSVTSSHFLYKVFIPKPGDAVAASYEGIWYRAQIIALLPGHVKVRYVDYGNIEIVPAEQIRVLFKEFKELPAQAFRLSLHGVAPLSEEKWSKKLCEGLAEMCTEKTCTAQVVSDCTSSEGLQLILTVTDTGENITNVLVKNGLAKRTVEEVQENEGMECRCTYVESPGEFYLMPLKDSHKLLELTTKLNELMESEELNNTDYSWQVNDDCVLKHGKNWVRCRIEELLSGTDRCKVRLVDSGQLISKPVSSLMRTPKAACESAVTIRASIADIIPAGGSGLWGPTAKETIKELIDSCDTCKVVPLGQAKDVLPCDLLIPEEQPRKYQGVQGEMIFISVKDRLLEKGVALRDGASLKTSPAKKTTLEKKALETSDAAIDITKKEKGKKLNESSCSANSVHTQDTPEICAQEERNVGQLSEDDMWPTGYGQFEKTITGSEVVDSRVPNPFSQMVEPIICHTSSVKLDSKKIFKASGDAGARMMKSPGGTIRSYIPEQGDPTSKLLHEAANRLAATQIGSPQRATAVENDKNVDVSSDSSSDVPTPELRLKLDQLVSMS